MAINQHKPSLFWGITALRKPFFHSPSHVCQVESTGRNPWIQLDVGNLQINPAFGDGLYNPFMVQW